MFNEKPFLDLAGMAPRHMGEPSDPNSWLSPIMKRIDPFLDYIYLRPDIYDGLALNLKLARPGQDEITLPFPEFIALQMVSVPIYRSRTLDRWNPIYAKCVFTDGSVQLFAEERSITVWEGPMNFVAFSWEILVSVRAEIAIELEARTAIRNMVRPAWATATGSR